MKVTITVESQSINPMEMEVQKFTDNRQVYIDDKKCPPTLNRIILRGLDEEMDEHIESLMDSLRGES